MTKKQEHSKPVLAEISDEPYISHFADSFGFMSVNPYITKIVFAKESAKDGSKSPVVELVLPSKGMAEMCFRFFETLATPDLRENFPKDYSSFLEMIDKVRAMK